MRRTSSKFLLLCVAFLALLASPYFPLVQAAEDSSYYREPVESFVGGALPRAERMGRTIPLEAFLRTHLDAPKVLLQVAEKYKSDSRVAIAVIDNSRGRGKAAISDLKFVRNVVAKYTPQELRARLLRALEDAYEKGKRGEKGGLSEAVYRGFKGHVR